MGEASDRIEQHIDAERRKLDWDLRQIEHKLRVRTRWLQRNSIILGVAVASGLLLSFLVTRLARS
jgi:hypothetical protein